MDHQWNLGLKVMYKNSIAELGNSDPLAVYESDFAQIQIQQETMNVAFTVELQWLEHLWAYGMFLE